MTFRGTIRLKKSAIVVIIFLTFILFLYNYKGEDQKQKKLDSEQSYNIARNVISLKRILSAAIYLTERGGKEVVIVKESARLGQENKGSSKEGALDPVTQGDFRSHRIIYYGMRKAFPKVKVISEEHTDNTALGEDAIPQFENREVSQSLFDDEMLEAEDITVWIDPLDATQEYTENLLKYVTTMVCVAVRGVPIIGVIHRPFQNETYWGVVGRGNSPRLDELAMKGRHKKHRFRILVSRSHAGKVKNFTAHALGGTDFEISQSAGAGYKVLEVIGGNADVYLHVTLIKKWDVCGGNALLESTGGSMSTLRGDTINYSSDTNPVNTRGILGYLHTSPKVQKLKEIHVASQT